MSLKAYVGPWKSSRKETSPKVESGTTSGERNRANAVATASRRTASGISSKKRANNASIVLRKSAPGGRGWSDCAGT